MKKGTLIIGSILLAAAAGTAYTVSTYKKKAANITFGFGFNRIHGLIGEGISKFLNPTIRTVFNIDIKNYSGLNLSAEKVYARLEVRTPGSNSWDVVATQTGYKNFTINDGKEISQEITMDVKGAAAITSLTNKKNLHRVAVSYVFKGVPGVYHEEIQIADQVTAYWNKMKLKFPGLTGVETNISLLA